MALAMLVSVMTVTAIASADGPQTWYTSSAGVGDGTTPDTPTTLEAAVDEAEAGDTIIVLDDITVGSSITLENSITIKGQVDGETRPTLDTSTTECYSIFQLSSDITVKFEDLIFDGSNVDNSGSTSSDPFYGGAICADGKDASNQCKNIDLTVNHCEFKSFEAYAGGAICFHRNENAALNVTNSVFTGGKSSLGGSAICFVDCSGSEVKIENCTFDANEAEGHGGAVASTGSATKVEHITITGCKFTNNKSTKIDYGGGAFAISHGGSKGGSWAKLQECTFEENSAYNGGAVFINATDKVQVGNCNFTRNSAQENGGAINIACGSENTEINFTGCTFDGNRAEKLGGAVSLASGGLKTRIDSVLFESNTTGLQGGNAIIFIQSTTATKSSVNSTNGAAFYNNGAEKDGLDRDTLLVYKMGGNYSKECVVDITDYMLDGTRLNWKLLGIDSDENYVLYDADRSEYAHLTGEAWNQHTELYLDNETRAPSESNVYSNVFINNYAGQFGGAISNRGSLTIGEPGEDITVNKVWDDEQEQEHDDVTVNLVRKSDGVELDSLTLGTENDWSGTFYGFPENVEYAVTEDPVEGYTPQITQDGNTVTVTNSSNSPIIVRPADITIYMGGKEGYGGTVDSSGTITGSSSLPTPGFVFEGLPDGVDPTDISFTGAEGRTWTVELYPGLEENAVHKLYIIVPAAEQEPVRVQFKDVEGNITTSDNFDVGEHVNQTLKMSLYKGSAGTVTAQIDGKSYRIQTDEAKLTVRGTSPSAEYASVNDSFVYSEPGLEAPEGTVYYINNSEVKVTDTDRVSLLFDDIIEEEGSTERKDALISRAEDVLGKTDTFSQRHYEFKYLDLVDQNNGNAWVAASEKVTVYWPLPAGTNRYTDFTLLHFEGLHREMSSESVISDIATCTVDYDYEITVSNTHVIFTIDRAAFSPFALVWETADYPVTPPVTPSEPDYKPEGLNTKDHFAYIIGYEDGTVRPNGSITRAEVATIFFRLLTDETREQYWSSTNSYTDVKAGDWFNNAVSTLSRMGILGGYADGTFRPNASITRAEFAKIAVSFFKYKDIAAENIFADVAPGSWYESFIAAAAEIGLIEGYEDGTFRPNSSITRAEACTIINRTLNRAPEKDHLLPVSEMNVWPDNPYTAWFYADMQEATNSHEYKWLGDIEQWLEKLPERDWAELEK